MLEVEYAVRGAVPQRATAYDKQLQEGNGGDLPFKKIVNANIGNPQLKGLDQKPITWWRQVSPTPIYRPRYQLTGRLEESPPASDRARPLLISLLRWP